MKAHFSILLLLIAVLGTAQTPVAPQVVTSSGNYHANGQVKLSWSLGEIAVTTIRNGNTIFTQGFQQPFNRCTNVITNKDQGEGSLRTAIECANAQTGPDTIRFFLTGNPPFLFQPQTPLPSMTDDGTVIDIISYSNLQPGDVVIDGSFSSNDPGLEIEGDNIEIRGLEIRNFASAPGISFQGSKSGWVRENIIHSNRIGIQLNANTNAVRINRNSLYCNSQNGILPGPSGNNNGNKAAPQIAAANTDRIDGTAAGGDSIEIFVHDPANCGQDICQGKTLVGTAQADGTGRWELRSPFLIALPEGAFVTATATDPNQGTSPFATCQPVCRLAIVMISDTICPGETACIGPDCFTTTGIYTDTLTTANGCDSIVTLDLTVIDLSDFPADAGPDRDACDDCNPLSGNSFPQIGAFGTWSTSTPDLEIKDPRDPLTEVCNLQPGRNELYWTLISEFCGEYDKDTIVLTRLASPIAVSDTLETLKKVPVEEYDLLLNDSVQEGWTFSLLNLPSENISVTELGFGAIRIVPDNSFAGQVIFQYELCNLDCETCVSADVVVNVLKASDPDRPPQYICPDCVKGGPWIPIPCLPDCYPKNQLTIVNRWGDTVFRTEIGEWNGEWDGTTNSGDPLPAGTYYYVLKLDLGEGEILIGEIIVVR